MQKPGCFRLSLCLRLKGIIMTDKNTVPPCQSSGIPSEGEVPGSADFLNAGGKEIVNHNQSINAAVMNPAGINGKRYATGMYGGCFNPLHLGHLECIIRAAGLCRDLYIVISYREHPSDIPLRVKIRWLYTLTRHLGNVHFIPLPDKVTRKEDYTEDLWLDDARKVRAEIGKPLNVVFCGSDYDENSFWQVCYPEAKLMVFPRSQYSSTAIRNDICGHWDWMPRAVRSYFVKKVLIIGGESSGKSTLTVNLAHYFNTVYLEEIGRDLSMLSGTDAWMLGEDFTRILLEHKDREIRLQDEADKVLFIDTDCLITRFFLDFLGAGAGASAAAEDTARNQRLSDAISDLNRYDLILFLEPDVEWVQDGDRSEVIAADRLRYSEMIKELYRSRGFGFQVISGDYNSRFDKAVSLVKDLLALNSSYPGFSGSPGGSARGAAAETPVG